MINSNLTIGRVVYTVQPADQAMYSKAAADVIRLGTGHTMRTDQPCPSCVAAICWLEEALSIPDQKYLLRKIESGYVGLDLVVVSVHDYLTS